MINYVLILGAVGTCIALFALGRKLFPDGFDLVMLVATGPIVLTSVYFDWVTWSWLRAFGVIFGTWATLISVVALGLMAKDKIKAEPQMEPNSSRPRRPATAADTTGFDVVLESFGNRKIGVIKVVRAATGLGLKDAKDLVEAAPSVVKDGIPKVDAAELKRELEEVGAKVLVRGTVRKEHARQQSTQHMIAPSQKVVAQ